MRVFIRNTGYYCSNGSLCENEQGDGYKQMVE